MEKESTFERLIRWVKFLADLLQDGKVKYDKHFKNVQSGETIEPLKTQEVE